MSLDSLFSIPTVRAFLLDGEVILTFRNVAKKYGLPEERAEEFFDLVKEVLDDKLPMSEIPGLLTQAFAIPEEQAKLISADILGYRVLPLHDFIPGVAEQIVAWGGDPKSYPVQGVGKEKVSAFVWAQRLAEATKLGFSDVLVKRLGLLIEGRSNGQKDAETLKTFFGRPLTIGGLALPKDKIEALLAEIERELPHTEVVSDAEYKAIEEAKLAAENAVEVEDAAEEEKAPEVVQVAQEVPRPKQALEISPSHELAAEVPVHAMPVDVRLKMAVDRTLEAAKEIVLAKNIPLDKFRSLAEKNIRGVRESGQTRDILEQEYKLAGADLKIVLDALAMGKKKYDGEKVIEGNKGLERVEEKAESNALDQKFATLTKTLPEESIEPILPGARVSAARENPMPSEKKIVPLKPRPAKTELTVGSVPPKDADRKMTDIVSASRLMGPVDQLRNMSTIEFRRMSNDPAEAARKVEDLLTALLATNYDERVNGIGAWRKSPINQMYLSISEEALGAGMSIPDVCAKRRKEGKDCLSPAEIKAIIGLNAKLRF